MRLGDLDALKKRVRQSTVSRPIKAAMEVLINTAPTIDPIRAAGGCRCGECKYYGPGPFGYGCNTMFDGRAAVIPHDPDHYCGGGKSREALDDG